MSGTEIVNKVTLLVNLLLISKCIFLKMLTVKI
jgi:hypothetical protein